jgi:hypothetical protein
MSLVKKLRSAANRSGFLDLYARCRRSITGSQVAVLIYNKVSPKDEFYNPRVLKQDEQLWECLFVRKNLISNRLTFFSMEKVLIPLSPPSCTKGKTFEQIFKLVI